MTREKRAFRVFFKVSNFYYTTSTARYGGLVLLLALSTHSTDTAILELEVPLALITIPAAS
ncbi:hypothetical protein CY34DRAFT_801629 [Suillus luteus UH-Slu-Lm8-n1]|uniref:Uncharacterized protein n=1 Tax=Suillus luteus UH-Slu-Lm8-n1 TaxID=930992 RepID=A0A0D0B6E3_9AGAM|nr:hypothetical protein CY34DRAFT_801629 [Suillus luteus UH-Slu-Lm8-n1]